VNKSNYVIQCIGCGWIHSAQRQETEKGKRFENSFKYSLNIQHYRIKRNKMGIACSKSGHKRIQNSKCTMTRPLEIIRIILVLVFNNAVI